MSLKTTTRAIDSKTTTDNTPTNIVSYVTPTNCVGAVECLVIGRNTDNGDCISSSKMYVFKNIQDITTIVSSTTIYDVSGDSGLNGVDISFTTSGNQINVQVVGLNNVNIVWLAILDIYLN